MPSSNEIRQQFLDYFIDRHGHSFAPPARLPALGDPSLMFVNSGMVQFKDIFLGLQEPKHTRVTNSQKCLRVSGKHNDLEEVGRDGTHHTFFEMLGYWSFGDYFKREAITWIWELMTDVWGLPKERLYATCFEGSDTEGVGRDQETADLWAAVTDIDHSHIRFFGKEDGNFWEMGDTGPCGPCSELHIDLTPDGSGGDAVNGDDPRVVELGNNVFITYNRSRDGSLSALPRQHVDFGGGFERIVCVLQGKTSTYDTDLFAPIIDATREIAGAKQYRGAWDDPVDTAYRVVADHLRCLTFAIADGVRPSNEGAGYVLRRVLRRAARHGRQALGMDEPFMHRLVPVLTDLMGGAFPELQQDPVAVASVIREEEEGFKRTLGRGIDLFDVAAARGSITGDDAFKLYDTYGFPLDLTQVMASERGLSVDVGGFERLMAEQRERSRAAAAAGAAGAGGVAVAYRGGPTDFLGYKVLEAEANILAIDSRIGPVLAASADEDVRLILDRTPFYAEGGGQVGDRGVLVGPAGNGDVLDCTSASVHLHRVRVTSGELRVGDTVHARVSTEHRAGVEPAHTATHMLHHTLRAKLGEHVRQMGSLVEPGRLHFDFSHRAGVPRDVLDELEETVNGRIAADDDVRWFDTSFREAVDELGALAFFEDKYGETVRVVQVGNYSRELCGGTHVGRTGRIGFVKILREASIGASIRRIEALTGVQGLRHVQERLRALDRAADLARVSPDEIAAGVDRLLRVQKDLQRALDQERSKQVGSVVDELVRDARDVGGARLVVMRRPEDRDTLRKVAVAARDRLGRGVVVLAGANGGASLVAAASAGIDAREILRAAAALIGGGAGGRPDLAQAGGRNPDGLDAALQAAARAAEEALRS